MPVTPVPAAGSAKSFAERDIFAWFFFVRGEDESFLIKIGAWDKGIILGRTRRKMTRGRNPPRMGRAHAATLSKRFLLVIILVLVTFENPSTRRSGTVASLSSCFVTAATGLFSSLSPKRPTAAFMTKAKNAQGRTSEKRKAKVALGDARVVSNDQLGGSGPGNSGLTWTIKKTTIGLVSTKQKVNRRENLSLSAAGCDDDNSNSPEVEEVDVAIVGAGIGGLCAGAILNTLYGKKVGVYESHYLPGGCAHAFERTIKTGTSSTTFLFDSGPTIVLGCSSEPYNPLQQVLRAVGVDSEVDWIPYDGWGMVEHPDKSSFETSGNNQQRRYNQKPETKRWKLEVGANKFEQGPLRSFSPSPPAAVAEFESLCKITLPLVTGAAAIPALAMRPGPTAIVPLLRYLPALLKLLQNGPDASTGSFAPYMDGPVFQIKDPWLRNLLDALAFSLSGLPACRTSAAAMAYVLWDMNRAGASLDYPRGGLGVVIDALVRGVEQDVRGGKGKSGSTVHLRRHVESINFNEAGDRAVGLTVLKPGSGKGNNKIEVRAKDGVVCNAPIWSLRKLIKQENALRILSGDDSSTGEQIFPAIKKPRQSWVTLKEPDAINARQSTLSPNPREEDPQKENQGFLTKCDTAEMTGSFLHLHLALNASGLDLDSLLPHYTVMDRGLEGDGTVINGIPDGPCGELNMIAVSNPCVLDRSLAPEGYIVVHAYGAGNEPMDIWKISANEVDAAGTQSTTDAASSYSNPQYKTKKDSRVITLWRAVESIIPDARNRTVLSLVGSPYTHERFLRRPYGTYGAAAEDCLKDGSTPIDNLILCGDGIFPGIGIPAVALSGASAANGMVGVWEQWRCMDKLKKRLDIT